MVVHSELDEPSIPLLIPLIAGAMALCWLLAPSSAQASMDYNPSSSSTQYIIVVDDSGSMRVRTQDGPAADPDRLAVFATRSLLSLLDDRDEVTVARLNGPADGEEITPIAPLRENRSRLESMLDLDSTLAQYPGQVTPCVQALDAVQRELDEAYRPGVDQVVLFLTDGECNDGALNPASFLDGVDSHLDGAFRFYLLRWEGRVYSDYLVDLADQTGGTVSIVGADDPTDLLAPFAQVMSHSQGHQAHLVEPRDSTLPAHSGAERMRLLAVAPGTGDDLSIQLTARDGGDIDAIGSTDTGIHQYEDGGIYRYSTIEYRPSSSSVDVSVSGANGDWQVVALPDYRLSVETTIRAGRCGDDGDEITYSEIGNDACLTIELVNQDGQRVTSDVTDSAIEADVAYDEPGQDDIRRLPANQIDDEAAFQFERANLEEGDHIFQPRVVIRGDDDVAIHGSPRSLQVSTQRVQSNPARLEFDDLLPGSEHYHEVTIDGNFPTTRGRLAVEGRSQIPPCLSFALNGVEEGEGQSISAGQTYTVEVHVDSYCGPAARDYRLDTALRVEFDQSSQAASIPSLVLPVRGQLIYELRAPANLEASIRAGDDVDLPLRITGNHRRDMELTALFPADNERGNWPGRHLQLSAIDADGNTVEPDSDGSLSAPVTIPAGESDEPEPALTIRASSNACCDGGQYRTEMALVGTDGASAPLRIPVDIEVESAGVWQCWGPYILGAIALLILLALAAYIANMWRSSRFLDPDSLADRLVPMQWDDFGEARPRNDAAARVRKTIRESMSFKNRAEAWLKANPLKFGLPGHEYYETVELVLHASSNVRRSRVRVVPEADFITDLRDNPRRGLARIYATARGGVSFYAVPAEDDRIGSFQIDKGFGGFDDDEAFEPEVEHLRRRTELLVMHTDREPDAMAGWRIG